MIQFDLTEVRGILCRIHVFGRRWTETGNLNDNRLVASCCEVIAGGRFGVKTASRQGLKLRLVKPVSILSYQYIYPPSRSKWLVVDMTLLAATNAFNVLACSLFCV